MKGMFICKQTPGLYPNQSLWLAQASLVAQTLFLETTCNDPWVVKITWGRGNGNPLQNFCLENSVDRRAWQAIVNGAVKSRTQLSN